MTELETNSRENELRGNNKLAALYTVVILGTATASVLWDGEVETAEVAAAGFISFMGILPIWGFLGEMKDVT